MMRRFGLGILGTVIAPSIVFAQRVSPVGVASLLDSLVPAAIARTHVPGAVVAVVRGDSVFALRGFGFARLEDSVHADPERSIYRLASVAKLFVATTVLRQVERGTMALDRDVMADAPDVAIAATYPQPVTIRNLLTHTGGFDERVVGYAAPSRETMRPLGEYLGSRLPYRGWPPGTLISYSNHGMALAAYAAERVAGVPFGNLAARDVFVPLGMTRTYYVDPPDDSIARDVAPGYRCGPGGCERAPVVWSHAYPVGLAFSTARDMSRFMLAELNAGMLDGQQALPEGVVTEAQRRQFTHHPALPGIGFAFFEQERHGVRLLTHAGGVPGTATALALAPSERVGVFVATNAGEPGFIKAVLNGVLDALLPPDSAPPPAATGPVGDYAGYYRLARYSHRTIEKFPGVFAFSIVAVADADTLVLRLGSESRRFVRVDSLQLRQVGGDATMALRRDTGGRVTHLFTGLPSGGAELPGAFERVPWYEGAYFLNEYVSWLLLLPLITLGVWGVVTAGRWWWRRRRGVAPAPVSRLARLAVGVAVLVTVLFLVFGFGFIAASTRQLGRGEGMAFGMSGRYLLLLRLAWVIAAASAGVLVFCLTAWRRRWWTVFGRVSYTVLAVCALAITHFLVWWNYLPGRW